MTLHSFSSLLSPGPDIDSPDRIQDVSSWAQKELSLTQGPNDELECDPSVGCTPSAEDEPPTMRMLSQRQAEDRNCISMDVRSAQGFRVQVRNVGSPQEGVALAESAAGAETSNTDIEKHVTPQGRTFDVYKTVC